MNHVFDLLRCPLHPDAGPLLPEQTSLRCPQCARVFAIVDGILCMEGDGPIMGSPKEMGLVIVGMNPTAVDATVSRLMEIDPAEVSYLKLAAGRLGPIDEVSIEQRGEPWRPHASRFQILDVPHLRSLRGKSGELIS